MMPEEIEGFVEMLEQLPSLPWYVDDDHRLRAAYSHAAIAKFYPMAFASNVASLMNAIPALLAAAEIAARVPKGTCLRCAHYNENCGLTKEKIRNYCPDKFEPIVGAE